MALTRYLGRAAVWSLPLCAAWFLSAPVTGAILGGFTQLFLALGHVAQPLPAAQRAHLGPVLFLALFLAAQPRGGRAVVHGVVGALFCIAAQGVTTALLLAVGSEPQAIGRLLRDLAIAADKIAPLAAALLLTPRARARHRPLAPAPALSARRRARPAPRRRHSPPPHPPLHPDPP